MHCEIKLAELRLRRHFVIAGGKASERRNAFFIIDGIGIGEGAGSVYYGAASEQIELELAVAADTINNEHSDIAEFILKHDGRFSSQAICAMSTAYHDYLCKKQKKKLYEYFGLEAPPKKKTSITVSIGDTEAIEEFVRAGYETIKLKMDTDEAKRKRMAEMLRKHASLRVRVDANGSWDIDFAKRFLADVEASQIELIEQPFSEEAVASWKELKDLTDIPLFMDESVTSADDVIRAKELCHGINVKIQKSGRIETAIQTLKTARSMGLQTMLGCMIESSVGIATAYHLSSLADFIDLDGRLLIKGDEFTGLSYENGYLVISDDPGHGVVFA